jgi:hypothetical protein
LLQHLPRANRANPFGDLRAVTDSDESEIDPGSDGRQLSVFVAVGETVEDGEWVEGWSRSRALVRLSLLDECAYVGGGRP